MRAISIMYHDVVKRGEDDASGFPGIDAALYKLEREEFDAHLQALASLRNSPVTILDIAPEMKGRTPLLLTFDDGGISAYTAVAGMLEEHGWRGHFLITANYIGAPTFVDPEQLRELQRRGHVIGSHSSSHPTRMSHCSREELVQEWKTSVETLSDILSEKVTVASVPGGYYSKQVAEAASAAGIKTLFNSEPVMTSREVNGCLVLGRYTVQRGMAAQVVAALGSGKAVPCLRQLLFWNAKKITKAVGGEYYLKVRKTLLGQR